MTMDRPPSPPKLGEEKSKRPRLSASLESKFGPKVRRDAEDYDKHKMSRSVSSDGRKKRPSQRTTLSVDDTGHSCHE